MAQPTPAVITLLLRALNSERGDDRARARSTFSRCTPTKMNSLYGESGKTRQQLLDEYDAHEKLCDEAQAFLEGYGDPISAMLSDPYLRGFRHGLELASQAIRNNCDLSQDEYASLVLYLKAEAR